MFNRNQDITEVSNAGNGKSHNQEEDVMSNRNLTETTDDSGRKPAAGVGNSRVAVWERRMMAKEYNTRRRQSNKRGDYDDRLCVENFWLNRGFAHWSTAGTFFDNILHLAIQENGDVEHTKKWNSAQKEVSKFPDWALAKKKYKEITERTGVSAKLLDLVSAYWFEGRYYQPQQLKGSQKQSEPKWTREGVACRRDLVVKEINYQMEKRSNLDKKKANLEARKHVASHFGIPIATVGHDWKKGNGRQHSEWSAEVKLARYELEKFSSEEEVEKEGIEILAGRVGVGKPVIERAIPLTFKKDTSAKEPAKKESDTSETPTRIIGERIRPTLAASVPAAPPVLLAGKSCVIDIVVRQYGEGIIINSTQIALAKQPNGEMCIRLEKDDEGNVVISKQVKSYERMS